jgi:hypothetical protein
MAKVRDVVLWLAFWFVVNVYVVNATIDSPRCYRRLCCWLALLVCVVLHAWSVYDAWSRTKVQERDLARRVMSVGQWQTLATCVGLSMQKICFVVFNLWRLGFRLETWTP